MVYEVKSTAKAIADKQLGNQARETLTARVHQKMFPTLRCLTAKSIWDNRRLFDHPENTNLFALLPIELRTSMLHQFSRHFFLRNFNEDGKAASEGSDNLSNRIMSLLLNQKVVSYKFPEGIRYEQDDGLSNPENPFWKMLLLKCPMLLGLSCSHYHVASTQHALFLDALMSMKHLQVLKLDQFSISDSTLCLIAQNLPNLRVLNVDFPEVASTNTMSAMSSLRQLEEFLFFVGDVVYPCCPVDKDPCKICSTPFELKHINNRKNLKLCLQSMPHLKFAGQRLVFKDNENAGYDIFLWSIVARITTHVLQWLEKPCTLGLQEVAASYLPEGINLPNLTSLHLYNPSSLFQCHYARLAKITELSLYKTDWDTCFNIVGVIGPQLNFLKIFDCMGGLETYPLDVILRMCPNLEHLAFYDCPLKKITMVGPVDLTNLKVLEFVAIHDSFNMDLSVELFLQLLQAPELRKLRFMPIRDEQSKLVEEITQQILQKLEHAIVWGNMTKASSFKLRDTLLDSMILHCPKLIHVSKSIIDCWPLLDSCWDGRSSCWDAKNYL